MRRHCPQEHHDTVQALIVDCANGVGAQHLQTLSQHLQQSGFMVTAKCTGDGVLNGACGADFIQKERRLPHTFAGVPQGSRYALLVDAIAVSQHFCVYPLLSKTAPAKGSPY